MKIINAIRIIEERERLNKRAEKEMQKQRISFRNQYMNMKNTEYGLGRGSAGPKNLVHVQSIFPKEDILALKMKTKESHIKEALLKAVYFYLENADEN